MVVSRHRIGPTKHRPRVAIAAKFDRAYDRVAPDGGRDRAARGDDKPKPQPFSREALERELNPAQVEAVMHPAGPLLVVAGAGSGKTRVITYRLARLVAAGADPRRILAVTFTNKAAGELRERVDKLLWERMGVGTRGLWVGTFHAIVRAPPAPVGRGGRPAQGLRHLRRRRSEAAARRAC